jgi:outer membrane lipopolysaccharide assembly protein LptE/RlpB
MPRKSKNAKPVTFKINIVVEGRTVTIACLFTNGQVREFVKFLTVEYMVLQSGTFPVNFKIDEELSDDDQ